MADFEVRREETDQAVTLTVIGEVDLWTAPALREALTHCFSSRRSVIVDARAVGFIDVSGTDLLIAAAHRAGAEGRQFSVLPSRQVRRVLDLVDRDHVVPTGHP